MNLSTWTGERLETFVWNDNTIEHLHRYAVATKYVRQKVVLDIACGEGYGSNVLAKHAKKVIGVDISMEAVEKAREKYLNDKLEFRRGEAAKIPLEDRSVDVVVSFETLEHHDQHDNMMMEILRVLKADGMLIMSSPDKKYYSDLRNYQNKFHVKELYFDEFKDLIKKHFSLSKFYVQAIFKSSVIIPEENILDFQIYDGDFVSIEEEGALFPLYNMCIASNSSFDIMKLSVFSGEKIESKSRELEIEAAKNSIIHAVRKSWSYRLGSLILAPIRLFKWKS